MTSLQQDLAEYIQALQQCARSTSRAEDRPLYDKYLAHAAGILAAAILGRADIELQKLVYDHDRIRGHTWLIDPVSETASAKWATIGRHFDRSAI